jgi:hypothetical protein
VTRSAFDSGEQLVHRRDKGGDALFQQRLRDVAHVDSRLRERLKRGAGVALGAARLDLPTLGNGQQRLHRHRVNGVWRDEVVDVQRLRVRRILRARGRPERALVERAGREEDSEAVAVKDLLEALVGRARVGERRGAGQVTAAERLQSLVDLGVDARDEEAGDRVHVERETLGVAALEPADEGLGDQRVLLDREQQRDVDVDPLVDRLLDRRHAGIGPGDLDHHVRAVESPPVVARLGQRTLGVVSEVGRDLEGDKAVAFLVVDRAQNVGGIGDIGHRDPLVERDRVESLASQLAQRLVVVR